MHRRPTWRGEHEPTHSISYGSPRVEMKRRHDKAPNSIFGMANRETSDEPVTPVEVSITCLQMVRNELGFRCVNRTANPPPRIVPLEYVAVGMEPIDGFYHLGECLVDR